jgi:hypothetical protein
MFLPISWISPCAVPITTVPADPLSPRSPGWVPALLLWL